MGWVSLFSQEKWTSAKQNSPYETVYSHLYFLQSDSYNAIESAKTITGVGEEASIELAIQIKQILDAKNLFVATTKIPKDAAYKDSLGKHIYYLFPDQLPEVYLEKKGEKWYYSDETIELTPFLHKQLYPYGSSILLKFLPKMGTGKFLGVMIWKYLGFLIFLLLGALIYVVLVRVLDSMFTRLAKTRFNYDESDMDTIHQIAKFVCFLLILYLLKLFLPVLQFPIRLNGAIYLILDVLRYAFLIYLGLRIFDYVTNHLKKAMQRHESPMVDQLFNILKKAVQIAIVGIGVAAILGRLGVNVTALIAGASIGGLAIALASQDSVKNLIGAFMIFIDRPFDIGDYIISGGVQGVVQEVGFRSTRIQASDTSIISVPNGKIANETVNNLGRRVYRRYRTQIGITYDTPPEKLQLFIKGVEEILRLHPETLDEKTEVHLTEFGASSLNIFLQTFFNVASWSEELREKQRLMLNIIKLARELNVSFAFPTQTIHISKEQEEASDDNLEIRMKEFLDDYKSQFKKPD